MAKFEAENPLGKNVFCTVSYICDAHEHNSRVWNLGEKGHGKSWRVMEFHFAKSAGTL